MIKYFGCLFIVILLCFPTLAFQEIQISFRPAENQPYFVGIPEINIDAEEFTTIVLRMKSNKSGTARLFWASSYDPQMNEPKSIWFFLEKSNDFKEYVFNLKSQNPYWLGFIGQLLIYPENGPQGIEIESAKAIPGNLITNIKSGWREFWGPRGRVVIGSTINTIQSSNLFGRSIFVYIYWLIGLAAVIIVGREANKWLSLKKKKKPSFIEVWEKAGLTTLFVLFTFWALLEISSLYNNWLIFKDEAKYFGKTLDEKLTIANTGDFYPFIKFCEKHLPINAKFDMRIPPFYNDIKARYYLYPRQVSTTEADYLVVYDLDVENEVASKYTLWKTFREKAYIMRKK